MQFITNPENKFCVFIICILILILFVWLIYMYKSHNEEHFSQCYGTYIKTPTGGYCKYTDAQCRKLGCIRATGSAPGINNTCLC